MTSASHTLPHKPVTRCHPSQSHAATPASHTQPHQPITRRHPSQSQAATSTNHKVPHQPITRCHPSQSHSATPANHKLPHQPITSCHINQSHAATSTSHFAARKSVNNAIDVSSPHQTCSSVYNVCVAVVITKVTAAPHTFATAIDTPRHLMVCCKVLWCSVFCGVVYRSVM